MKWIIKSFKILLRVGGMILLLSVGISMYFYFQREDIINAAIRQLNQQLIVPVDVHKVDVSFRHFPRLSVLFTQVRCTESVHKDPEVLLNAERVFVRFSLADVLFSRYYINEIGLENGYMHIKIFEDGSNNFSIFRSDSTSASNPVEIERLHLKNIQLTYSDFKEKIFSSQRVFQSEFSARYGDQTHVKGHWDAQNIYVRISDWVLEDPLLHSTSVQLLYDDHSTDLQLSKASFNGIKLEVNYLRDNARQQFSLHLKNQPVLSNPFVQNILRKYAVNYRIKSDALTGKIIGTRADNQWKWTSDFSARGRDLIMAADSIRIDEIKCMGNAVVDARGFDISLYQLESKSAGTKVAGAVSINRKKNTVVSGKIFVEGEPNGMARLTGTERFINGKGLINATAQFSYILEDGSKSKRNSDLPVDFDCTLTSDRLELSYGENVIVIPSLNLRIDNHGFSLRQSLTINNRHIDTDLHIDGVARWIVDSTASLSVQGTLYLQKYDEALWRAESDPRGAPLSALNRMKLNLKLHIGEYVSGRMSCSDIYAVITKSGSDIEIKSLGMNLFGGTLDFSGILSPTSYGLQLVGKSQLRKIDLSQLMLGFNDFDQNTLTHKNLFGRLSGMVNLNLPLSEGLDPDLQKLIAEMDIRVSNGRLLNFEPMEALGRFADVDELKDIRFEELINKLKIENQVIKIPLFEIRSNALNLVLEGTHSFENAIDYKVGLSLSDVVYQKRKKRRSVDDLVFEEDDNGARIWIRISGTIDQPRITPIKAELVRSRNQLFSKTKEEQADTISPSSKQSKSPFKFEWDEN